MAVILVSVTALCKDDIGNKTISRNSNGDSSAVFFLSDTDQTNCKNYCLQQKNM